MNDISIKLLNATHFFILLVPILIYMVPKKFIEPYAKFILLGATLIPLHWTYFENHCVFTKMSKEMGDLQNTKTTSGFSEANLKWLYEPIMRLFGWKWDIRGLDKIVTLHWIVNIILIWYFCFYYL